ncbi:hypothetical protein CYMTET_29082 [Cymbomonas tetramitiformis]|uniref:Uncharacterized protein n=1 Tax=Cymbomonas tetramitiformis TaxID=36881 RepID=A0AAE0KVB3_9CHLO|nr:hypothetical protein CYMTET_29082 [Cymbomonas tetramitiformis]|eukprot:gene12320-14548_t
MHITTLLITSALLFGMVAPETILPNDIVTVDCFRGNDETCSGDAAMRIAFDLCCDCFRWSFMGDVSSTEKGEYTLGDSDFGWLSHIPSTDCVAGSKGTANKRADDGCVKQPEGKSYNCKIYAIEHRAEACESVTPVCEHGSFPTDAYVPLEGAANPPIEDLQTPSSEHDNHDHDDASPTSAPTFAPPPPGVSDSAAVDTTPAFLAIVLPATALLSLS